MQKKFLVANVILLSIIIALFEGVAYLVIKGKLGEFDLETQGGTTMVQSFYQVWEHPANYKSWSGKTEFNNLGFRRREDTAIKKPDNTVRIFLMGGSAAFGSQAMPGSTYLEISGQGEYSNEETITYYLEQKLEAKYPQKNFEVINAATNWSRLHQQMLHYLRKIRLMEPDLILSMDAYNDSSAMIDGNTWHDTQLIGSERLFSNLKHKISPLFQSSYTAYLMAMLVFRTGESFSPDQELVDQYSQVNAPANFEEQIGQARVELAQDLNILLREYMNNMRYFDKILDEDKVPHTFYLQPLTILDDYKALTPVEKAIQGYQYDTLMPSQLLRINFFEGVAQAGERLDQAGVLKFESMLDVFDGVEANVYSDYCHFTPKGNELLAEYFLKDIEEKHPELLQ